MAKITGQFGEKRSYYKPGKFHEGVDLAFNMNDPIKAYGGGTVSFVGFDPNGYGNYIKIKGEDGRESLYAHANKINKKLGDLINVGDVIGLVGNTGHSTGPHLHFGLYENGKAINPMNMINQLPKIKQTLGGVVNPPQTTEAINDYVKNLLEQNIKLDERKTSLKEQQIQLINEMLNQPQTRVTPYTLKDVLEAPKGQKISTYAKYMDSPDFLKSVRNIFGEYKLDPTTGRAYTFMDDLINAKQNAYNNLQKQAITENKNRNDMIIDLMKELGLNDRSDKDIDYKKEKASQDYDIDLKKIDVDNRKVDVDITKTDIDKAYKEGLITNKQKEIALDQLKLNETKRHNKATEANAQTKMALSGQQNSGSTKEGNVKISTADAKQLSENRQTIATIDRGLQAIKNNPNAYSWVKGKMGATLANRLDPNGIQTRSEIDNVTAVYRKWLTGAQMSDKERKDYERFLPAPTDNGTIVAKKLQAMKNAIVAKNQVIESQYNISNDNIPQSVGKYKVRIK